MTARPHPDLFGTMQMSAAFSGPDDCYRDELRRVWDDARPLLVVCMLNPSTADHRKNDPTVLTLIHFAKLWGYGGLLIVNLYSFRASSPVAMMAAANPIGPGNGDAIERAFEYAKANGGQLLAAWGNDGSFDGRDEWFCNRALQAHGLTLICLGTTKGWTPKHPMARGKHRIPRDQQPIVWRRPPTCDEVTP